VSPDVDIESIKGSSVRYALWGGFMNTADVLVAIDAEIARLQQAKELLSETTSDSRRKRKSGPPPPQSGPAKPASTRQSL
jgi:hypothetical protein